ncbi:Mu transposase domain-containing protein [Paucibacter sp. PLA-PC-4]|uniref:Mu transposase domain-containing protein n=1 Tax=Paucibacter sp. PLA-PC-4 TaxID=2993655 RepID=UPI003A4C81E1
MHVPSQTTPKVSLSCSAGHARLPAVAPDLGARHRVTLHRDYHVWFNRNYYSAPHTLVSNPRARL